ncbi:MAG: PAS domain-containing protein, partial [Verrucomicrobia bacterium]|nr:PAS domain-containing protein [Verrucomicrobiota bacterium]
IKKDIREMVVFAPQNMLKDPPFTKLDLLCCRNLLIYLDPDLQKKLFPFFHYTLKTGGLLFLGSSESVGGFQESFGTLDKKWKIYHRKETIASGMAPLDLPTAQPIRIPLEHEHPKQSPKNREVLLPELVAKVLLENYSPPCVLTNEKGDILFIHGRTGKYLEPAAGQANLNIIDMAREGLKFELAAAIRRAHSRGKDVRYPFLQVRANGGNLFVDLTVRKLKGPERLRGLLLIVFEETDPPKPAEEGKNKTRLSARQRHRLGELEQELRYTKEHLQTTIEELETSNEELKSTNEELQSTNEELQSTNEELETSKEELHSLNEELVTVNTELQTKIDQLTQARDDLKNLLDSTKIATIFLDRNLCVKRFTSEATKVINLIQADIGRPISHIVSNLRLDSLVKDVKQVLDTLVFQESNVRAKDGRWFLMRIMPYRAADNVIDGVVLTFVDIDELLSKKQAEERPSSLQLAAETFRRFAEAIIQTTREPMLVLNAEMRIIAANRSFHQTFHTTTKDAEQKLLFELDQGAWNVPELRRLMEEIIPRNNSLEDFRVEIVFSKSGTRKLILNAHRILSQEFGISLILLAIEDATGRPES